MVYSGAVVCLTPEKAVRIAFNDRFPTRLKPFCSRLGTEEMDLMSLRQRATKLKLAEGAALGLRKSTRSSKIIGKPLKIDENP